MHRAPIRISRRDALALASGAAAAGVLTACGADEPPRAVFPGMNDEQILGAAIDLEEMAATAYAEALGVLPGAIAEVLAPFGDHELAHAAALRAALGEREPERPGVAPTEMPDEPVGAVLALGALERRQVEAYLDAIGRLESPDARETCARILVVQAQHLSELAIVQRQNPAPRALVDGST